MFEIGLFFFVCIIIGGRGDDPRAVHRHVILTALPELVAPLAKLGTFFYGLTAAGGRAADPRRAVGRLFEVLAERLRPSRIAAMR